MEDAIEQLQTKDTKERMAGVERLQTVLEHSRKGLSANEVGSLVDASLVLLKDNNFRVSQGTLQALASAAALAGEHLKLHFNSLLPAIVERLGDGKQPVRDAGRQLLLALMEISSPTIVVERARNFAWEHRKWRVREEFARTIASAVNLFAATELPFLRMLLPSVLRLLEDSNSSVREAAMLCLEEMYRQGGSQFRDALQSHQLRPAQFKDITCRLNDIEPMRCSFESMTNQIIPNKQERDTGQCIISERKLSFAAATARRSSLRVKSTLPETTFGGCCEAGDHQVDAIKVYSDKELVREIEKAIGLLTPEQDWSVRITAMQRIEGLVAGGATEYACFSTLMKQLVGPLNGQLSDRRSSIVKQACQLLNLMSRELLVNFEIFAESFIPVLFKLVVITVLVIAESADICIKTMLRNCRVSRVLPKLTECAKHDRNAVLRARCCEYALLVLEQWGESIEIQRSVDLYEDLIKCCVGDAVSEVRSSARMCHRVFSKLWPERAQRVFVTFDASVQRLLNEEGGVFQKRVVFPSVQDLGSEQQQPLKQSFNMPVTVTRHQAATAAAPAYLNPTTTHADRGMCTPSGLGIPVMNRSYQGTLADLVPARSLEKVLQASQQQVNAIEKMLKVGGKIDKSAARTFGNQDFIAGIREKGAVSSKAALRDPVGGSYAGICSASVTNHTGMDCPSASDPPFLTVEFASNEITSHATSLSRGNFGRDNFTGHASVNAGGVDNFRAQQLATSAILRDRHPQVVGSDQTGNECVGWSSITNTARRVPNDKSITNTSNGYSGETKGPKRVMRIGNADKSFTDRKGLDSSSIPGFQRPLLRQRSSGNPRSNVDESLLLAQFNTRGEIHNYPEASKPLTDSLAEGLGVNVDWSSRVAAFLSLRKILQQGPKGLQEVHQNFVMVVKLFSAHLDDPHHKVAHAALSTLVELIPVCRKSFEAYLERILPHVFGRVVDPKEVIRQLGSTVLEVVGNTYTIESLLPALLRSLDEQRSPKVKMTVMEFAVAASAKLASSGETAVGYGLLKLWLAKLGPLAHDKNPKLKEAAVTGIISVYSHFDSTTVLNFILGLSIEEQSLLRRSLKQYTPRIEVDLMTYIQNKGQRGRSKFVHDPSEPASAISENLAEPIMINYSSLTGSQSFLGYNSSSSYRDFSGEWESRQQDSIYTGNQYPQQTATSEPMLETLQSSESSGSTKEIPGDPNSDSFEAGQMKEMSDGIRGIDLKSNISGVLVKEPESYHSASDSDVECRKCSLADSRKLVYSGERFGREGSPKASQIIELKVETQVKYDDKFVRKVNNIVLSHDSDSTVPNLLQQMGSWGNVKSTKKNYEILVQLLMSRVNDSSAWSEYFNQILRVILESLNVSDIAVKELALSAIFEMLNNQKARLDESTEVLLEKLLQSTMDPDPKVTSAADRCRTVVLSEFDPHRCLGVLVQLLGTEEEIALIACISSLTTLVSRLAPEKLIAELPSFLPALFNAFGNQNADVRKTVVFCLVDIYMVLGEAFVPYLGSLTSTQLRLVTIYATRISQARTAPSVESGNM